MLPISAVLVVFGAIFVGLNWWCLIASLAFKKHSSLVPPLGGLLILIGLFFDPTWRHLAWVGLLVDAGSWVMAFAIPGMIADLRKTSAARLVLTLSGNFDDVKVLLRLYESAYYEIKFERVSKPLPEGWSARSSHGTWTLLNGRIELVSHTDTTDKPARAVLEPCSDTCYVVIASPSIPNRRFDAPEFPPAQISLSSNRPNKV